MPIINGGNLRYHVSDSGDDVFCGGVAGSWGGAYNLPENTNIQFVLYLYDTGTSDIQGGITRTW